MQPIATKPMMSIDQQIIASLQTVLGEGTHALHEPRFKGNEHRYVQECVASTFVSSVGQYVDRFERELAAFTGARRAGSRGEWYSSLASGPTVGRCEGG